MAFDADKFTEAMEPPTIVIKGREYKGRVLGHTEFEKLKPRFMNWVNGIYEDADKELREFLEGQGFTTEGVEAILSLPPAAIQAAIMDFFLAHSRAPMDYLRSQTEQADPTNGASSPPKVAVPQA